MSQKKSADPAKETKSWTPDPSKEEDRLKDEWQTARDLISSFDDRLTDLRKTGFGFVSALLTAQALLTSGVTNGGGSVPDLVKIGVIWVTFFLIGALRLTEKNYRFFQQAASLRAKILERHLNLELTETISKKYDQQGMWNYFNDLYYLLVFAAGVLGIAVILPNIFLVAAQIVVTLIAFFAVRMIGGLNRTVLTRDGDWNGDWTFSPSQCEPNQPVRITLTNLDNISLPYAKGELAWQIVRQDLSIVDGACGFFATDGVLEHEDNYDWVWHIPKKPDSDLYLIQPSWWNGLTLRRKIMVVRESVPTETPKSSSRESPDYS